MTAEWPSSRDWACSCFSTPFDHEGTCWRVWSLRHYPCVRTQDVNDCAVGALASVARYHGLHLSLPRLRELLGTDRSGTNLKGIVEAAERLGFQAGAYRGTLEAFPKLAPPFIAHVASDDGFGHFVVVYKVAKNSLVVADPAKGVRRISVREFQERWSGFVVVLIPILNVSWLAVRA